MGSQNIKSIRVRNQFAIAALRTISDGVSDADEINFLKYEVGENTILDQLVSSNLKECIMRARSGMMNSLGEAGFVLENKLLLKRSLVIGSCTIYISSYLSTNLIVVFGSGFNRLVGFIFYDNGEFNFYLEESDTNNRSLNNTISADFNIEKELSVSLNELRSYLTQSDSSHFKQALLIRHWHLGHHLWNELSVLQEIFDMGKWDSSWVLVKLNSNSEHFGLTRDLFKSKGSNEITLKSSECINEVIVRNNLCIYIPTSRHIKSSLTKKIVDHSKYYTSVLGHFINREPSHLNLLFNIRLGDRELINQMEFITSLSHKLTSLRQKHTIFIDGMNNNRGSKGESVANKSALEDEIEFANSLVKSLSKKCVSMIGCSIFESVYICNECDLYIAPWGAGLAKYAWVCNSNGLVHCSNYVRENKNDLNIYTDPRFREDAIGFSFLEAISDEDSHHADEFRRNYSIDVSAAVTQVLHHLGISNV